MISNEKVIKMLDKLTDLPLDKATEMLNTLFEDETWTVEEYNDLAEWFALHKAIVESEEKTQKEGSIVSCTIAKYTKTKHANSI